MSRVALILTGAETRLRAKSWIDKAPTGAIFTLADRRRSIPQNSRLWAMLTDVARQATWHGKKRSTSDWKDLFSGAVKAASGDLEAVPGLEGGFMILGLRTSEMTVAEMADLQTYIESWGAANGVTFSDYGSDGKGRGDANNVAPDAGP
jgi:hypothetical protein